MKQTVEVFLTGINFILFYCSDSIIELSTAKSTDYVKTVVDISIETSPKLHLTRDLDGLK